MKPLLFCVQTKTGYALVGEKSKRSPPHSPLPSTKSTTQEPKRVSLIIPSSRFSSPPSPPPSAVPLPLYLRKCQRQENSIRRIGIAQPHFLALRLCESISLLPYGPRKHEPRSDSTQRAGLVPLGFPLRRLFSSPQIGRSLRFQGVSWWLRDHFFRCTRCAPAGLF